MTKPTTNVARDEHGRITPGSVLNPEGVGGFQERMQDRSNGRWDPKQSRSYLLNKFQRMTERELKAYAIENNANLTIVEKSCIRSVLETIGEDQATALTWIKEVTDRTEGKPRQQVDTSLSVDETPTINITFA